MHSQLADYGVEAARCTRCGSCQSTCPVHLQTNTESTCARGKVFLIRQHLADKLPLSKELQEIVAKCLMCKACLVGCPSGVKTDALFYQVRHSLAEKVGLPWAKKVAFTGLTYRRLFDLALTLGAPFQGLFLKDAPDGRGKVARIPLPAAGLTMRRVLPSLSNKPLRARLGGTVKVSGTPKARVAFFPGCMMHYVYPEAGVALVNVLARNGVEAVVPEGLACCGMPALSNGDFGASAALAHNNVKALAEQRFDAIITGCASCGESLRHDYEHAIQDEKVFEIWEGLREKVYDISQYLDQNGMKPGDRPVNLKVTYHDPCHLVRGMGVSKEPRHLIKAVAGVDYREMQDAATCCGCGGTFSLTQYDLACKIDDVKVANAANTGAEVLVTGCSACRMHITDGFSRNGSPMRVMHTAELLAKSYGD